MKSLFKSPDSSVMAGLGEAAAVYVIYQSAMGAGMADIRMAQPHNTDIEAARKAAAWKSAGILAIVFLISKDLNSFLIGGTALAGIDFMYKHANAVHPATGKMAGSGGGAGENVTAFPLQDNSAEASGVAQAEAY
jgi:hypothetical protein